MIIHNYAVIITTDLLQEITTALRNIKAYFEVLTLVS